MEQPTDAQRALRLADVESERMAALIRIAIFASILTAVLVAQSAGFDRRPLRLISVEQSEPSRAAEA